MDKIEYCYADLTSEIISAAIEVHRHLGPGLLESAYEECLSYELGLKKVFFERQYSLPLEYKGIKLSCGFRVDLFVDQKVVLELKAVEKVLPVHKAQLLTYMKLLKAPVGLIINFNETKVTDGICRMVL